MDNLDISGDYSAGIFQRSKRYNLCIDRMRTYKRTQQFQESDLLIAEPPDDAELIGLRIALSTLPEDEGQIVPLHCISGFKHREIAAMLLIPEGMVRWKYRLALKRNRNPLGGEEDDRQAKWLAALM